jgi:ParB family chromosome partitioning protein
MINSINERNRLGKGLSSLLGEKSVSSILGSKSDNFLCEVAEINMDFIDRNPKQPRKDFNEEKLDELSDSIKRYGLLEPVILQKKNNARYEIIAGERRILASKKAGLKTVAAIIRNDNVDEQNSFLFSIIENVQRADLNCIEEAMAYDKLNKEYGITKESIASTVGKSRAHISNLMRLLTLPDKVQKYLLEGKLDVGHAKLMINYPYSANIVDYVVENKLSVREVEKLIGEDKKFPKILINKLKNLARTEIKDLEKTLGSGCKISFQERTGKYHLSMYFKNYDSLEEFIKTQGSAKNKESKK